MSTVFKDQYESSPLQGANATYVEWLYEQFLADPGSVPRRMAPILRLARGGWRRDPARPDRPGRRPQAATRRARRGLPPPAATEAAPASEKQAAVSRLIQVYSLAATRSRTSIRWVCRSGRSRPCCSFDFLGLDEADLRARVLHRRLAGTGTARMKLQDILALLKQIYCGKIGAEFAHISRARERPVAARAVRACACMATFSPDERNTILRQPHARRRPRALPAHAVRRAEAFLARRRRQPDPAARRTDPARRRAGRARTS